MSSAKKDEIDDDGMVYHNEPTRVGEGTLSAPDDFLYTTVEYIKKSVYH